MKKIHILLMVLLLAGIAKAADVDNFESYTAGILVIDTAVRYTDSQDWTRQGSSAGAIEATGGAGGGQFMSNGRSGGTGSTQGRYFSLAELGISEPGTYSVGFDYIVTASDANNTFQLVVITDDGDTAGNTRVGQVGIPFTLPGGGGTIDVDHVDVGNAGASTSGWVAHAGTEFTVDANDANVFIGFYTYGIDPDTEIGGIDNLVVGSGAPEPLRGTLITIK